MVQRGRSGTGSGPGREAGGRRATGTRSPARTARRRTDRGADAPRRPGTPRRARVKRTWAPRPPGRLTGRAVVLALVLVALTLSYVYPVRTYLAQRAQIQSLREHQARQRHHIAQLRAERRKWDDPKYVEAQAKSHLQMVRPGDKVYAVYDDPDVAARHDRSDRTGVRGGGPWYGKLWSSVQGADRRAR